MKKLSVLFLLLGILLTKADAAEATYIFNTEEGLAAIGLSADENFEEGKAYTWGDLTFTFTSGTANARIYNGSLRLYKNGGTMAISAPGDITRINIKGSGTMTASTGSYTQDNGNATWSGAAGTVMFTVASNEQITSITVTYEDDTTPTADATSLAEVQGLDDGTRVHIYLSDSQMARVTNTDDDVCLTDLSGTVYLRGITTNPTMAVNQHIAGYLTATKTSAGDKTLLEPAAGTSSYRLVIADRVTEDDVTGIQTLPAIHGKADNGHDYNLNGQRVGKNAHGIIIRNNKKILKR